VVVPLARKALRSMVEHLIVDATASKLGPSIKRLRREGIDLNINLLGEAILGEREAENRVKGTLDLIRRPDVDYVSIKVSATVAPHNHWAFDEAVDHIVDKLRPLYREARDSSPRTFINLDMEEYKDLDLTLAVFERLLSEDEFKQYEAGIVLQAYLPDSFAAMIHLQEFAAARVAAGGAPLKTRVVKGANLPMEQVDAAVHGWEQTVWPTKQDSDTNYKAILDFALHPERLANVHVGIAGHNLFDVATAYHLMKARGVSQGQGVEFEMLLGMATQQAEAVRADVGRLLLYTPVVHPQDFDSAIGYLIRRLEEGASSENFMSAVFELDSSEELFDREEKRYRAALQELKERGDVVPNPRREQDRRTETVTWDSANGFHNTPDSDPDLAGNREWGRAALAAIPGSTLGNDTINAATLNTEAELDSAVGQAESAAAAWQALTAAERATVLHAIGDKLAARRADLITVVGSETGKSIDQADPEISEAIDFAHYYAELGEELETVEGAKAAPVNLTVVTPPWNFPLAIPTGGVMAGLAAGSGVIIKPASQAKRTGAVMVECVWEALDEAAAAGLDISRDLVTLVRMGDRSLGTNLISHPSVGRVILTGGYETAEMFREAKPGLNLLAETSGKNAIIVTPSADLDLAAKDVAASAFGHAGQKCSASSLVILVGAAAKSERFHRQLVDAASSMHVGWATDPRSIVGPVIEPPMEKLRRGLTVLGEGESWVLEPKSLDDTDRLFSPGIRAGVKPGSEYHMTEYFGPILGVMTADTLEEAVKLVNAIPYGLTSGIHSLEAEEISYWVEHVEAGNLYINRGITGAIVRRQPFGGWKRSAVGAGTKAGGPNYLVGLSDWEDATSGGTMPTDSYGQAGKAVAAALSSGPDGVDAAWLGSALSTDADAVSLFSGARDVSALGVEINALRYRPVPVTVRAASVTDADVARLARVALAGARALAAVTSGAGTGAAVGITVSAPGSLPSGVERALVSAGATVVTESDDAWAARAARIAQDGPSDLERIRVVAADDAARAELTAATYAATGGRPDVAIYAQPVTGAGRVEMLPFLREQAISMTAHRFGTVNDLAERALGDVTVG
jgi:RHH-type proline utilization regulon transcriptional repressor/proline dehydrogenase/delta 1-pyrroline-5-carboxylate dehydrogenase